MAGRRILSERQLAAMGEMREIEGLTFKQISERFARVGVKISEGAVSWQLLRLGADGPPHRRNPKSYPRRPYRRGKVLVRPYTEAEDERILAMEAQGKTDAEIARALNNRKSNSVRARLMVLARREARAEEALGL